MQILKTAKRELLTKTAFLLFTKKGYVETRIADIAESCGMGKATFYEYFGSKESLFEEVFRMHVQDIYNDLPELLSKNDMTCREKLEKFVAFEFDIALKFGNHKNFIDHLIGQITTIQNKELRNVMKQFITLRLTLVTEVLKEGIKKDEIKNIDPMLGASIFLGSLGLYSSYHYGLLCDSNLNQQQNPFPPPMKSFFDLLFTGFMSYN